MLLPPQTRDHLGIPRGDYSSYWIAFFAITVLSVSSIFLLIWICHKFCLDLPKRNGKEQPVIGRWIFFETKRAALEAAKTTGVGLKPIVNETHRD